MKNILEINFFPFNANDKRRNPKTCESDDEKLQNDSLFDNEVLNENKLCPFFNNHAYQTEMKRSNFVHILSVSMTNFIKQNTFRKEDSPIFDPNDKFMFWLFIFLEK